MHMVPAAAVRAVRHAGAALRVRRAVSKFDQQNLASERRLNAGLDAPLALLVAASVLLLKIEVCCGA